MIAKKRPSSCLDSASAAIFPGFANRYPVGCPWRYPFEKGASRLASLPRGCFQLEHAHPGCLVSSSEELDSCVAKVDHTYESIRGHADLPKKIVEKSIEYLRQRLTPQGRSNSPGPDPLEPNLRRNTPLEENTWEILGQIISIKTFQN